MKRTIAPHEAQQLESLLGTAQRYSRLVEQQLEVMLDVLEVEEGEDANDVLIEALYDPERFRSAPEILAELGVKLDGAAWGGEPAETTQ